MINSAIHKTFRLKNAAVFAAASIFALSQTFAEVEVSTNFPGGNGVIEKISDEEIVLHQDLRDTASWWFYWNIEVKNAGGKNLTYKFTKLNNNPRVPLDAFGPAFSIDNGKTWKWLGAESVNKDGFTHKAPEGANSVRYSFAIPYQLADYQKFSEKFKSDERIKFENYSKTRGGRESPAIRMGSGKKGLFIVLTARHHSCESSASYVLEGIVDTLLSDPNCAGLIENAEFFIVPFVDLDGVENGDQGKMRSPYDHNRAYLDDTIYPEISAIMSEFEKRKSMKKIAIDLHCPFIGAVQKNGKHSIHSVIHLVGSANPENWKAQCRFSEILAAKNNSILPYLPSDNLPSGVSWNDAKHAIAPTFANFASKQPNSKLATTFEIPYANCRGVSTSAENLRSFGRAFAAAISAYADEILAQ